MDFIAVSGVCIIDMIIAGADEAKGISFSLRDCFDRSIGKHLIAELIGNIGY